MKRMVSMNLLDGTYYLNLWCGTEDEEQFKVRAAKTNPYVIAYGIRYDLTNKEKKDMIKLGQEYHKLHQVAVETCDLIKSNI